MINEFVATNQGGLQDEDGDYSDWVELYNPGSTPISLAGWSLSDDPAEPGKWVIPTRTLPVNGYLVIFASNKNRAPTSGQLHTNFRLDASGEYLGLFDSSTPRQVVDEFSPQFPTQYSDISYGRYNTPGEYRYFSHPTPGAANDFASSYLGVVVDIAFQIPRGYYDDSFTTALQTSTPGTTIRYSQSGCAPTSTSCGATYTAPVTIGDSMPLRAVANKTGYLSSRVGTHSYIMTSRVVNQPATPSGFPTYWGWYNGQQTPADYEMDPAIVYDPRYAGTIQQDMRSLPALSIALSRNDLFHEWTGIYANPLQTGDEWERPASVELIYPDGSTGFQVDAGLRIHGNSTRFPTVTPKHSLRLHFRSDYGASTLSYPLYPGSPVEEFDELVLNALHDDSWLSRPSGLYVRDPWVGATEIAMGRLGVHSKLVHLYLDGLYWGIYNITEHVDGEFAASYLGGVAADYDVIYDIGVDNVKAVSGDLQAWNAMIDIAEAGLADPANYQSIQQYLNLEDLSDFMLVHIYSGNPIPWIHVDWKAIRRREPGGQFDFLCWDNGSFLDYVYMDNSNVGADALNTPAYLYWRLRDNPEFRLLFADRAHRHFFNGGVFFADPANPSWDPQHPERNQPARRLVEWTDTVDRAVVAESARWGDVLVPQTPYHRDTHWVAERNRLLNTFFPQRSAIVLQQLRDAGLYPNVVAPAFNQHGGSVPAGFQLAISAPDGAVYFTTDGSDPRVPLSGAVAPGATTYTAPFTLPAGLTTVKARVLSGGVWSALNEATFEAPQDWSTLKLTEIMYNPLGGSDYEFLELKNSGSSTLNLAGVQLTTGVDFTFPAGFTLGPSQFAILVNNTTAFTSRYPNVPVAGEYFRDLGNGGDTIALLDPLGATILSVQYDDVAPWPTAPDGLGYSLVILDPNSDPNQATNWRASSFINGSPAADDPPPVFSGVVINEILAHSDLPFEDAIELHNTTNATVNIGGWFLSDDGLTPNKFRIPDGTTIPPYGFHVFYEYQFNPIPGIPPSFALSSTGETAFLFAADPNGNLTGYSHSVQFDASPTNTSLGRFATSTGVDFTTLSRTTFGVDNPTAVQQFRTGTGLPNAYPLVGPVVIHELMYNPAAAGSEFIELRNITNAAVPLFDPAYPANTWRFTNGVTFDFPPNLSIPAHGLLLVIPSSVDPAAFRSTYNVPADVPIFQYTGALDNGGETITLARPDTPETLTVPFIPVDSITYDDVPPWPTAPDGSGPSLERLSGPTYANDPTLWAASVPNGTPGRDNDACFPADVHPNKDHSHPTLCDGDVGIADIQTVASCWNQPLAVYGCPPSLNIDGSGAYVSVGDISASASSWGWRRQ